jgi:class 3 adenylate cyclase
VVGDVTTGTRSMRTPWLVAFVLPLPLAGLALLLAQPPLDMEWQHHPSHFWLVLLTALFSVGLAYVTNVAADRRKDARLVLVSLAFLASAGFLGLHALATPGVLLSHPNTGFTIATPVGLILASLFAAASVSPLAGPWSGATLRAGPWLRGGLLLLMLAWAGVSLADLPPLHGPPPEEEAIGLLDVLALGSIVLFVVAALRYIGLYRRRGGIVTIAIAVAFVLLAEAGRERRRLDQLFGPYLPAQVATRLRQEPSAARLGGEEREVTVLVADLAGFTTFSETRRPAEVISMLNAFWAVVVPAIDRAGGIVEQFAGDGVMVTFNALVDQPDHAVRAARAGLGIVSAARDLAAHHPGWPVFRVGINTGPAVVGNVGAAGRRAFAVIGDTTNTAARLMSVGGPGDVTIARATWQRLPASRDGTPLGEVRVKGRRTPVEAWHLAVVG